MDEEEVAAGLGPGWPSARVLANLQQHCIALSYEACQHSCEGAHPLNEPASSPPPRHVALNCAPAETYLWEST